MDKELNYLEKTFYVLYSHYKDVNKPAPDNHALGMALEYLDNLTERPITTDGNLSVVTLTLSNILRLGEQRKTLELWTRYRNKEFETASIELKALKEEFHRRKNVQTSDLARLNADTNDAIGPQLSMAATHRVVVNDVGNSEMHAARETKLLNLEEAKTMVNDIWIYLNNFITTPDCVKEGEGTRMRKCMKTLTDYFTKEQISPPPAAAITELINYADQRHAWTCMKTCRRQKKITAASTELDTFFNILEQKKVTYVEDGMSTVKNGNGQEESKSPVTVKEIALLQKTDDKVQNPSSASAKVNQQQKQQYGRTDTEENKENDKRQKKQIVSVPQRLENSKPRITKEVLLKEIQEKDRQIEELRNRLSRMAGDHLTEGNPNITDLSDTNRPTKLAEKFSELYDNEWSDAYEELRGMDKNRDELEVIGQLRQVLAKGQRFCRKMKNIQLENMCNSFRIEMVFCGEKDMTEGPELPPREDVDKLVDVATPLFERAQRDTASLSFPVLKWRFRKTIEEDTSMPTSGEMKYFWCFVDGCIELLWLMLVQDPPMCLEGCKAGDNSPQNFREYTTRGNTVVALVWPCLRLFKNGPVMSKGVAEMG